MIPKLIRLRPVIVPIATMWAVLTERRVLRKGVPLSEREMEAARGVGVRHPERVRVLVMEQVPIEKGTFLDWAGRKTGLLSPHIAGMCLRYGILVQRERVGDANLILHECVHVAQYERLGGIRRFLAVYLRECLELGYLGSPLEREAIEKGVALRV